VEEARENIVQRLEEELYSIRTLPAFATGQRALMVRSPGGNVLWDSVGLVDDVTIGLIRVLGGLSAIAASHPCHLTSLLDWSDAFDGIPIYVHEKARRWIASTHPGIRFWGGERLALHDGITLIHGDGHGGAVLHWPAGSKGAGTLLTGAVLHIAASLAHVSFLSSSYALLPRSGKEVKRIVRALEGLEYERLYDGSPDRAIASDARQVFLRSAEQYLAAIGGRPDAHRSFAACLWPGRSLR
jgi:hypothetical protein